MSKREFLMLAQVYDPAKHKVGGYYMSEKLDGVRCFWDGGVSRGMSTVDVPWAGVLDPKTGQRKSKIKSKATGLWSRYGNPIMAPDWFLNTLPCCPLDGELYLGRKSFQQTVSYVRKDIPVDDEWKQISFQVFSTPHIKQVLRTGHIKNAQQLTDIDFQRAEQCIINSPVVEDFHYLDAVGGASFASELAHLSEWIDSSSETVVLTQQVKLPADDEKAAYMVSETLKSILHAGGEGLMLRSPQSVWEPKRVASLLKVKGSLDDEGTLVGYTSGRKTNRGSKHLGKIGALILDYNGKRLELSGLTDDEREFSNSKDIEYAKENPGEDMPPGTSAKCFCIGDRITFTYRELTDDGIPKEARYLRKRTE